MSTNGLEAFDKTIHQTHVWLNEISDQLNVDRQHAYHVLRTVLQVLRDRLLPGEAAKVAAELPMLIRGMYFEGYKPDATPMPLRTREDFLTEVAFRYELDTPEDPEDAVRAVFNVLANHVSDGEVRKICRALPEPIAALWPQPVAGG